MNTKLNPICAGRSYSATTGFPPQVLIGTSGTFKEIHTVALRGQQLIAVLALIKCQFVDPPPYQNRAASSPEPAAVGNAHRCVTPTFFLSPGCRHGIVAAPHPSRAFGFKQCCLTRRSTGPATAGGASLARSGFATVARQAYTARLRGPVSSNVRQHNSAVAYLGLR